MAQYRLYFMNPHSGHIERVEEIEAPEDSEAVRIAEARKDGAPLELWHDGRKVHRIEAARPVPPHSTAA